MPPRRLKQRVVERLVINRVAEAIADYEINRANARGARPGNVGGAGSQNAGGVIAPEVHGCSYKTFLNCKPHSFNRTKGVVRLIRWFKKMESVFEISKCSQEDKVKFAACTLEGRALTWFNGNLLLKARRLNAMFGDFLRESKGNVTPSKPANINEAVNMARELVEQAVQAKATRIRERNKRKWEDHQRNNSNRNNNTHHQQQNRRHDATKAYVTAPAEGSGYGGNLP
ncbi:hypothetical protein Tco_0656433 [Tanacetum coccineum]|uniref:Reverse transcriptase domain-containing protein n=1 Tax=Tanacetum coccineum TaxID=301880 RepID=A0ABQ4X8V9_9ASTR